MPSNKTLSLLFAFLAVIGFSLSFYSTPNFALGQLKSAVDSGDKTELEARIDFSAVRQGLKDDLATKLAETPMTDDPYASAARDFAVSLMDGVVDAIVTPDNLLKLVKTGQIGPEGDEAMLSLSPSMRLHTEYIDFNTFKVTVADKYNQNASLYFVMTREGIYKWKVTSVHFPF